MICDRENSRACVVSWRARRLKRKISSSTAGEAMATLDMIGEVVYLKAILKEIFGSQAEKIPVVIATDSQNVHTAVYSTSQVEEAWSIVDIAAIKDAIDDEHVDMLLKVTGAQMLANCLTKRGAGAASFMEVLREGRYEIPGGWNQVRAFK